MKKLYYILSLLLLLTVMPAMAQGGGRPGPEQIQALKTAHITNALDLSSKEAQQFWPVYNEYEKRMEDVRKSQRQEMRQILAKGDNLSDNEASAFIDKFMNFRQLELDERKQLVNDLNGIISPQKILKLQQAEETFKRRLLKEIQRRRKN